MADKVIEFYISDFLKSEALKLEGSNLIDWYKRVFTMLNDNDAFEMAFKPMEEEPDNLADLEKYIDDKAISMSVKNVLCENMVPELRSRFDNLVYANSVIHDLILNFGAQWRLGQFEYFDMFLSQGWKKIPMWELTWIL